MPAVAGLELGGLLLEHGDELAADDLALGFGVAHAGQLAEEQIARVDADHFGVELALEHFHDEVALVQAQQAVVDEHAGQLVADGAVNERGGHALGKPRASPRDRHIAGGLCRILRWARLAASAIAAFPGWRAPRAPWFSGARRAARRVGWSLE